MKHAIALIVALSLTACATTSAPKVRLAEATAAYIALCGEVKASHQAGQLKGDSYAKARQACLTAHDGLGVADAALQAGESASAATPLQRVDMALAGLRALLLSIATTR